MAVFELQGPNGETFEIDAPDQQTAVQAFQSMGQGNAVPDPAPQAPNPSQFGAVPPGPAVPAQPAAQQGLASGILDQVTQGIFLGAGDELVAAESALLGRRPGGGTFDLFNFEGTTFAERYNAALQAERAQQEGFRAENPAAAIGANVAGGLASAIVGAPAVAARGAGVLANVGRGALAGAGIGAVTGFNEGEDGFQNRAANAVPGAVVGAAIGAAAPAVARGVSDMVQQFRRAGAAKLAPPIDALKQNARAAYQTAEQAGVIVSDQSLGNFITRLETTLGDAAIDPTLHPSAFAAMQRIRNSAGQHITFEGLERLRQVTLEAVKTVEARDSRMAGIIRSELDDFVENLAPADVLGGIDPSIAQAAIREARGFWRRMSKASQIEKLIDLADIRAGQFTQSGTENALRTEFRQFARRIVKGQEKGWSAEELAAIRRVAEGGPIDNLARMIGKWAPNGPVATASGVGTGFVAAGPVGAAVVPAAGKIGHRLATGITERNAAIAQGLAARGQSFTDAPVPAADLVGQAVFGQTVNAPGLADALLSRKRRGIPGRPAPR